MYFPNHYAHRKVAHASARSCEICRKPSTSVLVAPENKDFFYVCPIHLKDRGFCVPIVHKEVEAARKKMMEKEVARVKREYEEKLRVKTDREREGGKDGKKKNETQDSKSDKMKEEEGIEKGVDIDKSSDSKSQMSAPPPPPPPPGEEEATNFELRSAFFQQRIAKKRQIEVAKRNRERLQDPNFFPSVPQGDP